MFAYCGNNPVSQEDPTGHFYCKVCFDPFAPFDTGLVNIAGCAGGGSSIAMVDSHMLDAVYDLYVEFTVEFESELELLGGVDNVYSGIENIVTGFGRILVPEPTITNDVIGVAQATYGVIQAVWGLVEIIVWAEEET